MIYLGFKIVLGKRLTAPENATGLLLGRLR